MGRSRKAVAVAVAVAGAALAFSSWVPTALGHEPSDFLMVFPHPVEVSEFTDSWGAPRSGGRRHTGTDIMSPSGTEVYAVGDGVITRMKWHYLSGYYLVVEHADGWESYYVHLHGNQPYADGVEVGDDASAGELIGYVGASGNASTPHTHFELHHHGRALNPYPFLVASYQAGLKAALEERVRRGDLRMR